jgi:predicted transglutaminase-like cysteine proteinase
VVEHGDELMDLLYRINSAVNAEIRFELDSQQYGVEDYWALPTSGQGDCEDIALEKRRRLVAAGIAPAALRLAFVYHRSAMSPHSILTVETTLGTFLLDTASDRVRRWDQSAYNFEARERVDGRWDRYDQGGWAYD